MTPSLINWLTIAAVGDAGFVVGTGSGALIFFSHSGGRNLREVGRVNSPRNGCISDISVFSDAVVAVSGDMTVGVWSARKREQLALLRHEKNVSAVAVCERFIVSVTTDATIRVYANRDRCTLQKVLEGLHAISRNSETHSFYGFCLDFVTRG